MNTDTTTKNLSYLRSLIVKFIEDQSIADKYLRMTGSLAPDIEEKDITILGLRRAPAASRRHHTEEGGLVTHMLEMWDIWTRTRLGVFNPILDLMGNDTIPGVSSLTNENVLRAIIHHDLEKAYRTYRLVSETPWKTDYIKDHTSDLLRGDQKSLWILNRHEIYLDINLMNALFWAHGGFSESPAKGHTALSKMVYLIDEMSGSVLNNLRRREKYWT